MVRDFGYVDVGLRRIRLQISKELAQARREGRLGQELRRRARDARRWMREGGNGQRAVGRTTVQRRTSSKTR